MNKFIFGFMMLVVVGCSAGTESQNNNTDNICDFSSEITPLNPDLPLDECEHIGCWTGVVSDEVLQNWIDNDCEGKPTEYE